MRAWNWDQPGHIKDWIKKVNQIRRGHAALQFDHSLRFHDVDQDFLLVYSKTSPAGGGTVLTVINLDPLAAHEGHVRFFPEGLAPATAYRMRDLLSGMDYSWRGYANYVKLDPQACPAHIFKVEAPR